MLGSVDVRTSKASRRTRQNCPFHSEVPTKNPQIHTVDEGGDVLLHFRDDEASINIKYRCSTSELRQRSPYFDILLDPDKFVEGKRFNDELSLILDVYGDKRRMPIDQIPVVEIQDCGDLAPQDGHCTVALELFLSMLHQKESSILSRDEGHKLHILVLFAILADRFSATASASLFVQRLKRESGISDVSIDELSIRRKLLIGLLLEMGGVVRIHSACLVRHGSKGWTSHSQSNHEAEPENRRNGLWWALPQGIEGQT